MLQITEKAKETLTGILASNEGKILRIYFQGHG